MQRDSHRDSGLHFRSADSSTLLGFLRASWRDQSTSLEKVAWGTGQRGLHFEKCKFTLLLTKKIVPLTAYVHRLYYQESSPFYMKDTQSCYSACTRAKSLESCPTFCDPTDHGLPWDSPGKNTGVGCMPSSRESSWPRDRTHISCISCTGRQALYH